MSRNRESQTEFSIKKIAAVRYAADLYVSAESWWFDFRHKVNTSLNLREQGQHGWLEDKVNFHYAPTRPKWARQALGHLPAEVRQEYTFVDFGSGKGRVLVMAAQVGFRKLYGIELRRELHEQACQNFLQFRNTYDSRIESLNIDATEYDLPADKLVLFFFNPFGEEVMGKVMQRMERSLNANFRDIWVVLHGSVCSYLADQSPHLRVEVESPAYRIYRSKSALI